MNLKTFVKVNSITNLSDARYCAGMGVNQLGFCEDPEDKNYVSKATIDEITGWISGVEIVSEINNKNITTTTELVETCSLHNISAEKKVSIKLTIEEAEKNIEDLQKLSNLAYVMVIDNGNIDESKLNRINLLSSQLPIVVGFGITAENVNSIIEASQIKGIALSGTDEIRPGFKDYNELGDILEAIEVD